MWWGEAGAGERVGQNRRRFKTYKFRTMVYGADGVQHRLEHLNEARGPVFKIKEDPRITRVGRWLRRTSIDELPQLWCVLRGTMSLVGPRPPLPYESVQYQPWHLRRILSVKPGITGWAQVNGWRGDTSLEKRVEFDLYYVRHWSLAFNLRILLLTPFRILIDKSGS